MMQIKITKLILLLLLLLSFTDAAGAYASHTESLNEIKIIYEEDPVTLTWLYDQINNDSILTHDGKIWYLNASIRLYSDGEMYINDTDVSELRISNYKSDVGLYSGRFYIENVSIKSWNHAENRAAHKNEKQVGINIYKGFVRNSNLSNLKAVQIREPLFDVYNIFITDSNIGLMNYDLNNIKLYNIEVRDTVGSAIGLYRCSNTEVYNVHVENAGDYLNPGTGRHAIVYDSNSYNGYIHDVYVDGTGWSSIDVTGESGNISIYNVTVYNSGHNGLDIHNGYDITVDKMFIYDSVSNNILVTGPGPGYGTHDVLLRDVVSSGAYPGAGALIGTCASNVTFINYSSQNDGSGIKSLNSLNLRALNITEKNSVHGIVFTKDSTYNGDVEDAIIIDDDLSDDVYLAYSTNSKFINLKSNELNLDNRFASEATTYYYSDIIAQDSSGVRLPYATVSFTNEVDSSLSSLNGWGDDKIMFSTTDVGQIPLPDEDRNVSPVIAEYYRSSEGVYVPFSHTAGISTPDGKKVSLSGISPDSSWYRPDPNTPTYTITAIIPEDSTGPHITGFAPGEDNSFNTGDNKKFQVWADEDLTEMKWYVDGVLVSQGSLEYIWNIPDKEVHTIKFDGSNANGIVTHVWNINDEDNSPSITTFFPADSSPDQNIGESTSFSVTTDKDLTATTWSVDDVIVDSNSMSTTWIWDTPGTYDVAFVGSNDYGSVLQTWTVNVIDATVNTNPVLSSIGDWTVDEGSTLSFVVSASDADGDTLTYSATGLPSGASFDAASGEFHWTPSDGQAGTYKVTFEVSDGDLLDSETIMITVNSVNTAPVMDTIGGQTVDEGSTLSFVVSSSDSDGDTLTYSVTGLPTGATFDTAFGEFSWTPDVGQAGIYSIIFEVTDGRLIDSETVVVTVNEGFSSVTDGETISYVNGLDNRLREASPDAILSETTFVDVGHITGTSRYRDVMWFNLSEYNTTDSITSATLSLFWYYPDNTPRNQDTVVEIYRASDWDPAHVSWNNKGAGIPWNNQGGDWFDKNDVAQGSVPYASITFSSGEVPDNGYHEFDVTELVQDYVSGEHANTGFFIKARNEYDNYIAFYGTDSMNTNQRPNLMVTHSTATEPVSNLAPVLDTIGSQTVDEGSTLSFTVSASDADGDTLTYSAIDLPAGATFDTTSGGFIWNPSDDQAGTYSVAFEVTDGELTDSESIIITVNTVNKAPMMDTIGSQTVDEGSTLSLTVSASDVDGDSLTYSATGLPAGATFDTSSGGFIWTPSDDQAGTYSMTFEVTDGELTDSESIIITVNPVDNGASLNTAPVITSFEPDNEAVFEEGHTIYIGVTASDIDGDKLNYLLKIDGVTVSTTSSYVWSTDNSNAGTHTIEAVVSDGLDQVTAQHILTIINPHPRWDVNRDGVVNILDITIVAQNIGTDKPHPSWDVNQDGEVNIQDLAIVAYYFGETIQ